MRVTSIILAAIFGAAVALPVENAPESNDIYSRYNAIEQMIVDMLEEFRIFMQTGSDDIPVLDPLELEHLNLELDDLGFPGSHLTAENVDVRYLSNFVLDEVSANLATILPPRYRIIINGYIPVIEIGAGKYDLSVNVMGATVFGNGDAKMKIIEPRVRAEILANIGLTGGITISLYSAHVTFGLKAFESEITGMFGDDIANDFINLFLANLVPEMVEFFEEEISNILSDLIMEIGNDLFPSFARDARMRQLTVAAMLPILESSGGDMPPMLEAAGLQ